MSVTVLMNERAGRYTTLDATIGSGVDYHGKVLWCDLDGDGLPDIIADAPMNEVERLVYRNRGRVRAGGELAGGELLWERALLL